MADYSDYSLCCSSLRNLPPFASLRTAQPRSTEEQCRSIFEKGERIEQEFAEYFTGKHIKNILHTVFHLRSAFHYCRCT